MPKLLKIPTGVGAPVSVRFRSANHYVVMRLILETAREEIPEGAAILPVGQMEVLLEDGTITTEPYRNHLTRAARLYIEVCAMLMLQQGY